MKRALGILLLSTQLFAFDLNNATVKFVPSHSGKCLNTRDKADQYGTGIVQWECSDQKYQRFHIELNADGFYFIRSTGSNLCFGVPYAFYGYDGLSLLQVGCEPTKNKSNEFTFVYTGHDLYTIRPRRAQNTCLAVANASQNWFASVVQEPCSNKANQLFHLVQQ